MQNNFENIDKSKLKSALDGAAERSGINAASLRSALDSGKVENVLNSLSHDQADKLRELLSDKKALNNILKSPQAAKILKELYNK